MDGDAMPASQQVAARYFEMWNSGDSSIAAEILSLAWIDHAHPEVTGPRSVQLAVERIRAARPGLRFHIEAMLGDGDLVAVVGTTGQGPQPQWLAGTGASGCAGARVRTAGLSLARALGGMRAGHR